MCNIIILHNSRPKQFMIILINSVVEYYSGFMIFTFSLIVSALDVQCKILILKPGENHCNNILFPFISVPQSHNDKMTENVRYKCENVLKTKSCRSNNNNSKNLHSKFRTVS